MVRSRTQQKVVDVEMQGTELRSQSGGGVVYSKPYPDRAELT